MGLKREDLLQEIFEVLYTFCLSKATLKSISRDIYPGIECIFNELDEHKKGELDKVDLKLILKDSNIKVKESDLTILMNHFGDGVLITVLSLKEVIAIQKNKWYSHIYRFCIFDCYHLERGINFLLVWIIIATIYSFSLNISALLMKRLPVSWMTCPFPIR